MFPSRMLVRLAPLILAGLVGGGLSAAGGPAVAASKCNAAERTALTVAVAAFDKATTAYNVAGAVAGEATTRYASAKESYRSAVEIARFLKRTVFNTSRTLTRVGRTGSAPALKDLKRALRNAQAQLLEQLDIVQYWSGNVKVLLAASRTADSAFKLKGKQVDNARKALNKLSTRCAVVPRPSGTGTTTPSATSTPGAGSWTGAFCRLYRDYDTGFQSHLSYSVGDEGFTTGGYFTNRAAAQVAAMAPYASNSAQRDWVGYASRFYSMVGDADPTGWSNGWPDDSTLDWYELGWTTNSDFTIAEPALELLTRQDNLDQCLTSTLDETCSPSPRDTATVPTGSDSEFNKPAVLPLPDGNKAQVMLSTPKTFNPDPLGFPEFGKYKDDRAVYFMVTVNNTTAEEISVQDLEISGKTSNSAAPICRALQGDDGTISLLGAVDPDTWEALESIKPGGSARFLWGVVCQTPKGKTLSLEVSVGTGKPKIYDTTMP